MEVADESALAQIDDDFFSTLDPEENYYGEGIIEENEVGQGDFDEEAEVGWSMYEKFPKKDRHGRKGGVGDISCGKYATHEALREACSAESTCVGYTIRKKKGKEKPWCLKLATSKAIAKANDHTYYKKHRTANYEIKDAGELCDEDKTPTVKEECEAVSGYFTNNGFTTSEGKA